MKKPFIIGEVSANHNGKIEQAKDYSLAKILAYQLLNSKHIPLVQ